MSCTVPTGLRSAFVDTAFPTLKCGANKHCAYGAAARTFLMQESIKLIAVFQAMVPF
jgi:hypothetical protein